MTRTFVFTAVAALISLTQTQPVLAGNAGASLGACYNHVISACNQTNHPESCASAGMDACDDYHATHAATPGLGIKIMDLGGGRFKAKFVGGQSTRPTPDTDREDKDDRTPSRDPGRDAGRSASR